MQVVNCDSALAVYVLGVFAEIMLEPVQKVPRCVLDLLLHEKGEGYFYA